MDTDNSVSRHYTRGRLQEAILAALAQSGRDAGHLEPFDLAPVDEFHLGGIEATRQLASRMELRRGLRLLDVGSGIGGPARFMAVEHGCRVTGVDITPEFVQVAGALSRLVGIDGDVEFRHSDAASLPFAEADFDRAYMIHVGMNIPDKAAVFREVRRVLKPGGVFAIFDILLTAIAPGRYPVPWAPDERIDHIAGPQTYCEALAGAGFRVESQVGQRQFAIEFLKRVMARARESGPPVIGLQLLVGDRTPLMLSNMLQMLREGRLEPVELIARAV